MSEDPKSGLFEGLGDLDWDSALDNWEKTAFDPNAKPADAKPKAEPAAALPKPPSLVELEGDPEDGDEVTALHSSVAIAKAFEEGPASDEALVNAPGTVIAPVPRELRSESAPPASGSSPGVVPPARGSSPRGGLNQLFSRPPQAPAAKPFIPRPAPPAPGSSSPTSPGQNQRSSERTLVERPAGFDSEPAPLSPVSPPSRRSAVPSAPPPDDEGIAVIEGTPEPGPPPRPGPHDPLPDSSEDVTQDHPALVSGRPSDIGPTVSTRAIASTLQRSLEDTGDHETLVRDRDRGSMSDADTATRHPAEDEEPTIGRPSKQPAANIPGDGDLRIAPRDRGLGEDAGRLPVTPAAAVPPDAFAERIDWLEEEARGIVDALKRGRALLAVSELAALAGDRERALSLAMEARDTAPDLPLAWRQARQLMMRDPELMVDALDQEALRSPTPASRVHATLMAADLLRINGLGDGAVERWESACKLDPADARGPVARAALALAQNDHTNGNLRLAENSELVPFDKAVATALRLRGVERAGAEVEDMPINDGLRHARSALDAGDVVATAQSLGEIAAATELAKGAHWVSSSFGALHIASRRASARSLKSLAGDDEPLARRQLAARGIELGDPELVAAAMGDGRENDAIFDSAERAVIARLAAQKGGDTPTEPALLADLISDDAMRPLVDALAALVAPANDADAEARAHHVAGRRQTRALAALGRLLARNDSDAIDEALAAVAEPRPPSAAGVVIETSVREKRWGQLSEALSSLPDTDDSQGAAQRHVAAAIVAERAGDRARAKNAWAAAARATIERNDPSSAEGGRDGILRIAAELDPRLDLGAEVLRLADAMPDGVPAAILRLEALARASTSDDEQAIILERVHRAAPALGIGSFLAERIARRKGDLDEVLRWIQERRSHGSDPLETALDSVREALLVADRDPDLASTRLAEAHRARPDDVPLRELHERLSPEPLADRGDWRERRADAAERAGGAGSAILWLEAALEHERGGDSDASLRAARRAERAGDRGLSGPIIERGEIATGDPKRQTAHLVELAKNAPNELERREALERLAHLELAAKGDKAAATAHHKAILETSPRHKPSLRWVEHALIGEGRDAELAPVFEQIAIALDESAGGEVTGHAQHAARLRVRDAASSPSGPGAGPSPWERTHDIAGLAATQPEPSLWALRATNAHSRLRKDDRALLQSTLALLDRTQRPAERATLLLRASEASSRLEQVSEARSYLEQAAAEDPGDVVTWGFLAEMRGRANKPRAAAEACESLARTSAVREHQLLAWHDAAKIWLDEVKDLDHAMSALEAAAEIDVTYADVFPRLSALYADKRLDSELAALLEKRLATIQDEEERVSLEVELARAFAEMGELAKAKDALKSALDARPDHTTALSALADLCAKEGDWPGAEQALVRLVRLLSDPAEQRAIYERLGEIYATHAPNLSRAEVALKEVLKRSPDDANVLLRLVDVYKRQGDVPKAVETQQQIIALSNEPTTRLSHLVELAKIHESVGRDPRRSEQVLDSARKEFPTSVVALRAMAEFYARQRQMPAMQILLDRAAGDARRSFAQGRFVPALFQVLHAAFELRGKRDAARVVAATLAAVEGQDSDLGGADAGAVDPRLDDLIAPDMMSPALRALLFRAGDSLDIVAPVDLRALRAAPLQPGTSLGATIGAVATVIGLGALQILVSPQLGRVATPLSSNPPTLLVGEGLARTKNERARVFVVVRALKMILAHSSALVRSAPQEVAPLVAGLFTAFNPSYVPQGLPAQRAVDWARRIGPAIPRSVDPTVGVIALEAAGMLGTRWNMLGAAATGWASRVALLAVGDPNAALDAIAWDKNEEKAPTGSEERAAWISRHAEARDLMTFSVTDAYAEARVRLGLDK